MDFRKGIAGQPEIIRTIQKDAYYTEELAGTLSDLLRWLSIQKWITYHHRCQLIAEFAYHGFAAMHRIQTLGEEYTGILQIDKSFKQIPSKYIQLLTILFEFGGETMYMKILQIFEKAFDNCNNSLPELNDILKYVIYTLKNLPSTISLLHKCLFYIFSGKYQISKRLTGINYVRIRHWLQPNISIFSYKMLGMLILLQIISQMGVQICRVWSLIKSKSNLLKSAEFADEGVLPGKRSLAIPSCLNRSEMRNCTLCLEKRSSTSLTPCGHLFCWTCLLHWLDERAECPLCRETLNKSQVLQLKNYT